MMLTSIQNSVANNSAFFDGPLHNFSIIDACFGNILQEVYLLGRFYSYNNYSLLLLNSSSNLTIIASFNLTVSTSETKLRIIRKNNQIYIGFSTQILII